MSERKYRQRGYQDESRPQRPAPTKQPSERAPGPPRDRVGPRTYDMPGYREVARCARCGHIITGEIRGGELLPEVRHGPARVRAVRALRHRQAVSVRADHSGARVRRRMRGMRARSSSRSAGSSGRRGPPRLDRRAHARRSTISSNSCALRAPRRGRAVLLQPRSAVPRPAREPCRTSAARWTPENAGGNIRPRPVN